MLSVETGQFSETRADAFARLRTKKLLCFFAMSACLSGSARRLASLPQPRSKTAREQFAVGFDPALHRFFFRRAGIALNAG